MVVFQAAGEGLTPSGRSNYSVMCGKETEDRTFLLSQKRAEEVPYIQGLGKSGLIRLAWNQENVGSNPTSLTNMILPD